MLIIFNEDQRLTKQYLFTTLESFELVDYQSVGDVIYGIIYDVNNTHSRYQINKIIKSKFANVYKLSKSGHEWYAEIQNYPTS